MEDLPFLVVHGAWVWKVIVLLFAATAAALHAHQHRRRTARHLGVVATTRVASADTLRDGATVVLRGRLRARASTTAAAATVALQPTPGIVEQTVHACARVSDLILDTGDTQLRLSGPVRVIVGSTEATGRGAVPEVPAMLTAELEHLTDRYPWALGGHLPVAGKTLGPTRLATVADGDEVIAAGVARSRAGGAATYRDLAARWELDAGDADEILLAAAAPTRARLRPPPRFTLAAAAAGAVLGLFVAWATGAIALGVDGHDALTIAAAMPGSREVALDRMEHTLYMQPVQTRASEEQRVALLKLRDDCWDQAAVHSENRRYEEAAAQLRQCGPAASGELVKVLLQLGRIDEAAAVASEHHVHVRADVAVTAYLLAKRWPEAARLAAAVADDPSCLWPMTPDGQQRARWRCLGHAAAARAGDPAALDRLRTAADSADGYHCVPLLLDALPPDERAERASAWLARTEPDPRIRHRVINSFEDRANTRLVTLIALQTHPTWLADAEAPEDMFRNAFRPFALPVEFDPHWLMALPLSAAADRTLAPEDASPMRARMLEAAAMLALVAGDVPRAEELGYRAQQLWMRLPRAQRSSSQVDRLRGTIAYRRGEELLPAADPQGEHLWLRKGQVPARRWLDGWLSADQEGALHGALVRAAEGDATALAAELQGHTRFDRKDWIFALAPRLQRGVADIEEVMLWGEDWSVMYGSPVHWLAETSAYRDLFTLLRNPTEAARWKAMADAQWKIVNDRELTVLLAVAHAGIVSRF